MSKENEKIWRTADGRRIPVSKMNEGHLMTAFTSIADREYRKFQEVKPLLATIDKLQEVKEMLLEEMEKRGIVPIYPDQKFASNPYHADYGNYFEAERKVKAMEPVQKAVLSTDIVK